MLMDFSKRINKPTLTTNQFESPAVGCKLGKLNQSLILRKYYVKMFCKYFSRF